MCFNLPVSTISGSLAGSLQFLRRRLLPAQPTANQTMKRILALWALELFCAFNSQLSTAGAELIQEFNQLRQVVEKFARPEKTKP
jgi:hypothetical protein